jgi:hypothetical protein
LGAIRSEHVVQFFDTDESLAGCVAAFLVRGYRSGQALLLVARPRNTERILEALECAGLPVADAIASHRLVVEDAFELMRLFLRHGRPDPRRFTETVGQRVAELGARGTVCAYGEMVDILAQRADLPEAIELERLWNDLGTRVPLSLMCGYCAAHFVPTANHRALRDICAEHTSVHRNEQDPMADWVLTTAHHPAGDAIQH